MISRLAVVWTGVGIASFSDFVFFTLRASQPPHQTKLAGKTLLPGLRVQAEEAAELERATADELLAHLKEKEAEISQLRCAGDPMIESSVE